MNKIEERYIYKTAGGQETPINIVKCEDGNFRIVVGNNLMTNKTFKSKEETEQYMDDIDIELIGSLCVLFVDGLLSIKNDSKKQDKNTMSEPQRAAD